MNWANRITLSRLALTVLFVVALNSSWQYARTAALVIFLIAGLTDLIDGEIARRYGLITNFGKLMDPLVDKIMVAAAFISLVPLKAVPAWAATTVHDYFLSRPSFNCRTAVCQPNIDLVAASLA